MECFIFLWWVTTAGSICELAPRTQYLRLSVRFCINGISNYAPIEPKFSRGTKINGTVRRKWWGGRSRIPSRICWCGIQGNYPFRRTGCISIKECNYQVSILLNPSPLTGMCFKSLFNIARKNRDTYYQRSRKREAATSSNISDELLMSVRVESSTETRKINV
jgi:hypothetical protein